MTLVEKIDYFISNRIRPTLYSRCARWFGSPILDSFLCSIYSGTFTVRPHHIESCLGYFLFDVKDRETYVKLLTKHFPGVVDATINEANLVLDHQFELLGSGKVDLGTKINWHRDFKSGYKWDLNYHFEMEKIKLDDNSDIKVPWELSRFHHLNVLGRAYWLSENEDYAKEFVDQILDWVANNPPRMGVNWCCPMDVAIRLVNWTSAYFFFRSSPSFSSIHRKIFFESILIQQIFIYYNLEFSYRLELGEQNGKKQAVNGNHLIANLTGLIIPSLAFPKLASGRILRKAQELLAIEVVNQVNEDGVHHELSLSYHRLVTEMFLALLLLLRMNGREIHSQFAKKVEMMIDFLVAVVRPDGDIPGVRDGDDGRVLPFTSHLTSDCSYLFNIAAVVFNRPDLKGAADHFTQEAFWWMGPSGLMKFGELPEARREPESKDFPRSGFYVMKKRDNYFLAICAGLGLSGMGGHAHNDALSFELSASGNRIIVDPGTYVYSSDPDFRNLFRSTSYHSTIRIDGKEINRIDEDRLFSLANDAQPVVEKWVTKDNYDLLIARHSGYEKLVPKVVHRRIFLFDKVKSRWIIRDHLMGNGTHYIESFLHLDPDISPGIGNDKKSILIFKGGQPLFTLVIEDLEDWKVEFTEGWVSPSFGIKRKAWKVSLSRLVKLPIKKTMTLVSGIGNNRMESENCIKVDQHTFS